MDPAVVVLLVKSDLNASWREQEHMLTEPMFLPVDGLHATGPRCGEPYRGGRERRATGVVVGVAAAC